MWKPSVLVSAKSSSSPTASVWDFWHRPGWPKYIGGRGRREGQVQRDTELGVDKDYLTELHGTTVDPLAASCVLSSWDVGLPR